MPMKRKKVYLTCGPAGAGKSTWIREQMKKCEAVRVWCSRDKVRFSLLRENDEYFSKEKEVFIKWVKDIKSAIEDKTVEAVFIDATHLDEKSRNKVLNKLPLDNVDIIPVNFMTSLGDCLYYNHYRTGREFIPRDVIVDMYNRFDPATFNEKYHYADILTVSGKEL